MKKYVHVFINESCNFSPIYIMLFLEHSSVSIKYIKVLGYFQETSVNCFLDIMKYCLHYSLVKSNENCHYMIIVPYSK